MKGSGHKFRRRVSERRVFKGHNELDAFHMSPLEARIVGNEEVNPGCRGTCQLDCVGSAKRSLTSEPSIDSRRFGVEGEHQRRCRNGFLVFSAEFLIPTLDRFNENLAERQRRGQQLIATRQHSAPKIRNPGRKVTILLK